MFITEEEAKRRLEDKRNIFSPNYSPEEDDAEEASPTPENKQSEEKGSHTSGTDVDRLLAGAVNPQLVRERSGRLKGKTDVQVAVGATAEILGPVAAGQLFGLSHPQAVAYNNGLSSSANLATGHQSNPERGRRMKSVKEQLAELASGRLSKALTSLTDTKISELKATQLSGIAKDMAVVMDKVTRENNQSEGIHFHIFRPEMKTVENYTTVRVTSPIVTPQDGKAD